MDKKRVNKLEKNLIAERGELVRLAEATEDDRKPVELDQAQQGRLSRLDAIQVQEMALEQERRREIEIARIDAALKRIGEDEYGYCVSCGEEIAPERLDNNPAVPTCIECASK
ncbi:MAG: TraR/DksA family transcriptional regulator [Rhodospirillales bacterium]|nr:molecular chaperone DnaK [Rhodospirillaceae bacterium]MDP6429529.1 TraR/DksA family transcriptional regulator [Rhodospirillales bacterium]MDP6646334.1 TraR/DksA family transcriptional regulator [Rhodospirillales bacterium]MDP6842687.1 TraR/DksA family transcriptional regulator [Rhodospirillales bacterium]